MAHKDARTELVIFDFDGTLVDTAPDLIRSVNFYLEKKGYEALPPERIRAEIGLGLRKLILDLHPNPVTDAMARKIEGEFLRIYEGECLTSPTLFPGAMEFLTEWDRQIAIVSNKRIQFIHRIMEKVAIAHLDWTAVVGGDTYPHMKPHPQPFLAAMQAADVGPEETVIVGDGLPDVKGAVGMDIRCVAVEFGYTSYIDLMALGAWRSIAHFDELFPLLTSPRP